MRTIETIVLPRELELVIGMAVESFAFDMKGRYDVSNENAPLWVIFQEEGDGYKTVAVYPSQDCLLVLANVLWHPNREQCARLGHGIRPGRRGHSADICNRTAIQYLS